MLTYLTACFKKQLWTETEESDIEEMTFKLWQAHFQLLQRPGEGSGLPFSGDVQVSECDWSVGQGKEHWRRDLKGGTQQELDIMQQRRVRQGTWAVR